MSAKSATLAKSLHTVSVLVAVARMVGCTTGNAQDRDPAACVALALTVLGYDDAADPHGLADKAVALLVKERSRAQPAPRAAVVRDAMSERPGLC